MSHHPGLKVAVVTTGIQITTSILTPSYPGQLPTNSSEASKAYLRALSMCVKTWTHCSPFHVWAVGVDVLVPANSVKELGGWSWTEWLKHWYISLTWLIAAQQRQHAVNHQHTATCLLTLSPLNYNYNYLRCLPYSLYTCTYARTLITTEISVSVVFCNYQHRNLYP